MPSPDSKLVAQVFVTDDPSLNDRETLMGMIAEREGRFDEARAWYLDALRAKPMRSRR